jgi:hypothetical protein
MIYKSCEMIEIIRDELGRSCDLIYLKKSDKLMIEKNSLTPDLFLSKSVEFSHPATKWLQSKNGTGRHGP